MSGGGPYDSVYQGSLRRLTRLSAAHGARRLTARSLSARVLEDSKRPPVCLHPVQCGRGRAVAVVQRRRRSLSARALVAVRCAGHDCGAEEDRELVVHVRGRAGRGGPHAPRTVGNRPLPGPLQLSAQRDLHHLHTRAHHGQHSRHEVAHHHTQATAAATPLSCAPLTLPCSMLPLLVVVAMGVQSPHPPSKQRRVRAAAGDRFSHSSALCARRPLHSSPRRAAWLTCPRWSCSRRSSLPGW